MSPPDNVEGSDESEPLEEEVVLPENFALGTDITPDDFPEGGIEIISLESEYVKTDRICEKCNGVRGKVVHLFRLNNIEFQVGGEQMPLEEFCRMHPEVLRHIVLKLESESDKRAAKQAEHLERKAAKQAKEGSLQKKTVTEKKAEDTGKQDKELEDVLGNL